MWKKTTPEKPECNYRHLNLRDLYKILKTISELKKDLLIKKEQVPSDPLSEVYNINENSAWRTYETSLYGDIDNVIRTIRECISEKLNPNNSKRLDRVTFTNLIDIKRKILNYRYETKEFNFKEYHLSSVAMARINDNASLLKEKNKFYELKNTETNKYEYFEKEKYILFDNKIYNLEDYTLINNKLYSYKELKNKKYFGIHNNVEIFINSPIKDSEVERTQSFPLKTIMPLYLENSNDELFFNKLYSKIFKNKKILSNIFRSRENINILKSIKTDDNIKFYVPRSSDNILSLSLIKLAIDESLDLSRVNGPLSAQETERKELSYLINNDKREVVFSGTVYEIKIKNAFEYILAFKILTCASTSKKIDLCAYMSDGECNDEELLSYEQD